MKIDSVIDVAISVASPDIEIARSIAKMLERRGLKVYFFIDSPEQTLGRKLKESLERIYSSATIVIAICSQSYNTEYTKIELAAALQGKSAENGLVAVLTDKSDVPEQLQGRVYWELQHGYADLVSLILRRFDIKPFSIPVLLLLATMLSTGLYWLLLFGLGFDDVGRMPDQLFLVSGLLPIVWVSLFRIMPILVNRFRRANQRAKISRQGVLERRLDTISPYLAWVFGLAMMTSLALAYKTLVEVKNQIEDMSSLSRDMGQFFDEYYRDFTSVTGLATQASFSTNAKASAELLNEYDKNNTKFLLTGEKLRGRLSGAWLFSSSGLADDFISFTDLLERTSNVNIRYQMAELARSQASFGSPEIQLRNRAMKKDALLRYNQLYTETMLAAQENYRNLQSTLDTEKQRLNSTWYRLLK